MSTFREDAIHVMRDLQTERKINNLKAENTKLRERIRDARYEDELYGLRCAFRFLKRRTLSYENWCKICGFGAMKAIWIIRVKNGK